MLNYCVSFVTLRIDLFYQPVVQAADLHLQSTKQCKPRLKIHINKKKEKHDVMSSFILKFIHTRVETDSDTLIVSMNFLFEKERLVLLLNAAESCRMLLKAVAATNVYY